MFKKDDFVRNKNYGYEGFIKKVFDNWDDLKNSSEFITLDPNNEGKNMNEAERIMKEDPRDNWLKIQKIKYTKEQLNEKWYSVDCIGGGGFWSCESNIELINKY